MSDLLVDSGNTRVKWALSDVGIWNTGAVVVAGRDLHKLLDDAWSPLAPPDRVLASHVADSARWQILTDWTRRTWGVSITRVQSEPELLGVRNGYREPERLGADRWAALIGVRGLTQGSACVIDCGTAVTLDALTADGNFAGGVIFPGLALLRQSLAQGTAALPVAPGAVTSCLARSTADAIAAGTLYGLAGALERVLQEFERTLGQLQMYITGGDAEQIAPYLARTVRREPQLVLKGLARIAALKR